jgi:hypothetical protein
MQVVNTSGPLSVASMELAIRVKTQGNPAFLASRPLRREQTIFTILHRLSKTRTDERHYSRPNLGMLQGDPISQERDS